MNVGGYLKIKTNMVWGKSVLGKVYSVSINGIKFQIHFPKLSEKRDSLVSPDIINELHLNDKSIEYGFVLSSPNNDSIIDYVVITGEVSNSQEIKELYEQIDNWVIDFLSIIKLKKDIIATKGCIKYKSDCLELFVINNNNAIRSNANSAIITFTQITQTISNGCVNSAIDIINKGISIPEEYKYYLRAVKYYENKQYRYCVLECATAAEKVITNRIIENCERNCIKGYKHTLRKYNGLESKYGVLIFFDDNPQLDIKKIAKPRNNAIHNGKDISVSDAKECLHITKKLLDKYKKFW